MTKESFVQAFCALKRELERCQENALTDTAGVEFWQNEVLEVEAAIKELQELQAQQARGVLVRALDAARAQGDTAAIAACEKDLQTANVQYITQVAGFLFDVAGDSVVTLRDALDTILEASPQDETVTPSGLITAEFAGNGKRFTLYADGGIVGVHAAPPEKGDA